MSDVRFNGEWENLSDGKTYVLNALDPEGKVIARVTVTADWGTYFSFAQKHGDIGWREVEQCAKNQLMQLLEKYKKQV